MPYFLDVFTARKAAQLEPMQLRSRGCEAYIFLDQDYMHLITD